jgi:hypothetical protein
VQSLETAKQPKLPDGAEMLNHVEPLLVEIEMPPLILARFVPSPEHAILPVKILLPSAVQATVLPVTLLETQVAPPLIEPQIVPPTPVGAA